MSLLRAAVCVLLVLASAWWAFARPLRSLPGDPPPLAAAGPADADGAKPEAEPFDLAAFRAPLWVAPPAPPPPAAPPAAPPKPAPEPPPPPLKWQLLAIVRHGAPGADAGSLVAMIYDADHDAVLTLAPGQTHAGRTIESIRDDRVVVRNGRHTHTLRLKDEPAASGAAP